MTNINSRQSAAFPTVAMLRKGGPKIKRDGKEMMGPDLNDRFRIDWLPGVDPAIRQMFLDIYKTDQPHSLRAMVAFPSVWQAWSTTNEAYWGTSRFAVADNEHYLYLANPFTWEPIIRHGEPFKPFIAGEILTFENNQGEPQAFKLNPTTRFDLFLPELIGCFVTFQIKTRSSGDLINLRRNLAAVQAAADALGQRTGAAGIPIIVSRREDTVMWHKAPGQTLPIKKWLIDIRPDPGSKWAKTFAERLAALALFAPIAVDEDPSNDGDLGDSEESEAVADTQTSPANIPTAEIRTLPEALAESIPAASPLPSLEAIDSTAPVQPSVQATLTTLASAPVGQPEKTVDPLRPKTAHDYSAFWVTTYPKLAELHKDISSKGIKEMAKASMAEAGNDTIMAYELLLQKITAALPTA